MMHTGHLSSKKHDNDDRKIHHELVKLNKKAVIVLASLVIGQYLLMNNIVDAGELTTDKLLECTNAIRARYHDSQLVLNSQLNEAAHGKLQDMQDYNYWSHGNPVTGEMPWDFVDRTGYYYQTTGENLAHGFHSAQEICDAWEQSETHLANIANSTFQEVGFAIDKANLHKQGHGILVVQMFGSRDDFIPEEKKPQEPADCLTRQGCEALGMEGSVLGTSDHKQHPVMRFVSENIFIFVTICSYGVFKILLVSFYGKSATANKKSRSRKH